MKVVCSMGMSYSVLMSTYAGENPDFLRKSMKSVFNQTVSTNNFVLVCDGVLTPPLENVIKNFKRRYGSILCIVRMPKNLGLPIALNIGLANCLYEVVARMDSDDIAHPARMERQLAEMDGIDILGSSVIEFATTLNDLKTQRKTPLNRCEIIEFAKRRNPFNHPSVMYRKSKVLEAGGYEQFSLCEDYQLWVKMIMAGCNVKNLKEPLLYMRVGSGLYKRRGGVKYFLTMFKFRRWLKNVGFCGQKDFVISMLYHAFSCFSPSFVRRYFYEKFLREKFLA